MAYTPSKLDSSQILPAAFDDATGALRTTAQLVATGESNIVISQEDDSIRLGDGSQLITATSVSGAVGLDVNVVGGVVSGNFNSSGLSTGLKTQTITITDVPTKVPATPLDNRNAICVRVFSNVTVYFGDSTLTAANGYPKFFKEEIILDIKGNSAVELYAVCDTGVSGELRILEVA